MTDARMERIINQLAELTEEEEQVVIDRITTARIRRKNEKFYKLRDNFLTLQESQKNQDIVFIGETIEQTLMNLTLNKRA